MKSLACANSGPANKGSNFHSAVMRSQNYEKGNTSHSDESDHDTQNKMGVSVEVAADGQNDDQRNHRGGDSGSAASSSRSNQMIIKKNIQYTVQYEEAALQKRKDRSLSRRQKRANEKTTRTKGNRVWAIPSCRLERKVGGRMPSKVRPGHCLKTKKCVSRAHG